MSIPQILALLLALLIGLAALAPSEGEPGWPIVRIGFLYGLPLLLIGSLRTKARWALMAAVIYGTVGLALDIATFVQDLTKGPGGPWRIGLSLASGGVNFLLIVFGGRGFLNVTGTALSPQESRRPNPPSPS